MDEYQNEVILGRLGLKPLCTTVVTCLSSGGFPLSKVAPGEKLVLKGNPDNIRFEDVDRITSNKNKLPVLVDILGMSSCRLTDPLTAVRLSDWYGFVDPQYVILRLLFFVGSDRREKTIASLCGDGPVSSLEAGGNRLTTAFIPQRRIVIARVGLLPFGAVKAA